MRSFRSVIAVASVVLLTLTGCGVESTAPPTAASSSSAPATTTPPAPTSEATKPPLPEAEFFTVAAADLPELTGDTTVEQNARILASDPDFAGFDALNKETSDFVQTRLDNYLDHEVQPEPEQYISVGWETLGVSADMLGVLQVSDTSEDELTSLNRNTVWYDIKNKKVLNLPDLVTEQGMQTVKKAVQDALTQHIDNPELETALSILATSEPAVGFDRSGNLVIGYDTHRIAHESAGAPLITVPSQGLLSEDGERALNAAMNPKKLQIQAPAPAPTRTATKPATPAASATKPAPSKPPTTGANQPGEAPAASEPEPPAEPQPAQPEPAQPEPQQPEEPAAPEQPEPPAAPAPAPPAPGGVDCSVQKCVALTFDDGPSAKQTPRLLDILKQKGVPATFFVLGQQVQARPDIVQRAVAEGHEIANHTWSHPQLTAVNSDKARREIQRSQDAIRAATGVTPTLIRPPYGSHNARVDGVLAQAGLANILWSVDTLDWQSKNPSKIIAKASKARPGAIILMHDIHGTTIQAVPGAIDALHAKGYVFVTVTQLLGQTQPGVTYRSRR